MIKKQNILELFGGDSRMYHSVIITCYSFDFLFFEERVLPRIRGAGMVNINIFMDAGNYEKQVIALENSQYKSKKAYSITPIKMPSAFHPKIIFSSGKDNGFLAIGSGNITNSGLSSNDEIWGAFHTYKGQGDASPLFSVVYRYLMQLAPLSYGINKTKLDWIYDNSGWLKELNTKERLPTKITINENDIILLASLADNSILSELINYLPKSFPDRICIVAPYYNKDGRILNVFNSKLQPKRIDVVIDERFGTIPYKMELASSIHFHKWSEVRTNTGKESPRLHAKMFQFEYDNATYLLMGSANCSSEALGTLNSTGQNAEMVIFLRSESKKDWMKELGIEIPKKGNYQLTQYKPNPNNEPFKPSQRFQHKIQHAELNMEQLQLNLDFGKDAENIQSIVIVNRDNTSAKYPLDVSSEFQTIVLTSAEANLCFKVYLANTNNIKVSNVSLIHNYNLLSNTNPDARYTRFQEIISGDHLADSDLLELLDYANFNKINKNSTGGRQVLKKKNEEEEQDSNNYEIVSGEVFNKNDGVPQVKSSSHTSQLSTLEDFLNHMLFGDNNNEDISDSGERTALENKDKGFKDDKEAVKLNPKMSYADGKRLTRKLHNKLYELHKFISNRHLPLLNALVGKENFLLEITIEDIQALLVGTHLIFMKMDEKFVEERAKIRLKYDNINCLMHWEKERGIALKKAEIQDKTEFSEVTYTIDKSALSKISERVNAIHGLTLTYQDETPSIEIPHFFFTPNPISANAKPYLSSIKGFLINVACPFLLLLTNGKERYLVQEENRYITLKNRLFYRLLILTANNNWKNDEYELFTLFVLNLIYCLYPKSLDINDMWKELEKQKDRIIINNAIYSNNIESIQKILNDYFKWRNTYDTDKPVLIQDINTSKIGKIIFKKQFGFLSLSMLYKDTVNLSTPLGVFIKEKGKYEISDLKMGSKAIFYNY
jgi:hypothetical protein